MAVNFQEAKSTVQEKFAEGDVRAGLQYLNSLAPHRFTGLFLFKDPELNNQYIVDKEDPLLEELPENIPQEASYCAFTRSKGSSLSIEDSLEDERVRDHPARNELRSYCGVPLQDDEGNIFGTVCHYDQEPHDIDNHLVWLLEEVAPALSKHRANRPPQGKKV